MRLIMLGNFMENFWLEALRERYKQFRDMPCPNNSELRRKGVLFSRRKAMIHFYHQTRKEWLEELKGYARVSPPPVPERWEGKEKEYYKYNYKFIL